MIGKVLSYDKTSYQIKFTVPLYIEEGEALPLNTWDRPNPGDEVYIFEDDSFGGLYCYAKMGSRDPKVHKLQTDSLEILMDEDKGNLSISHTSGMKLNIDMSGKKINLSFSGADLTVDTDKIHLGNKGNQPAVLFNEYERRFKELYAALASHKHGSSMGPTTPPIGGELSKFSGSFPSTLSNDKSNSVDIMK